ncbi:MAG: hypothetical protein ABUT20_63045, partial [Bacteroidota bacterium]
MSKLKVEIGEIVCVKYHHHIQDASEAIIAGDTLGIAPYMVVTELFFSFSLNSRRKQSNLSRVRAVWYNQKSGTFESAWFSIGEIRKIEDNELPQFPNNLIVGSSVQLNSFHLELGKLKSTFNSQNISSKTYTYNSLLSFISPPLLVIAIDKNS